MSDNLRKAAMAYDAFQASAAGLKGLFTAPYNDAKRALLAERLEAAFHHLVTCRRLLDRADGDERFVLTSLPPRARSWGRESREAARVGKSEAAAPSQDDSPTLSAARSVPPHEGEGANVVPLRRAAR